MSLLTIFECPIYPFCIGYCFQMLLRQEPAYEYIVHPGGFKKQWLIKKYWDGGGETGAKQKAMKDSNIPRHST